MGGHFTRFGPQVIGRTMFDYGYPNWGENPPFHAPVFVVTHRGQERISKSSGTSYTFVTGGVAAAVEQARAVAYGKDVLLAGGVRIARQARAAGLVGKVVLHVVPKLMGRGVRLFDASEVDLRCVETIQGEGAVHLRYEVRRSLATLGRGWQSAVACAGYFGPDPRHDLVRLVLGDLDELVLQVAALSGYQFWAEFPGQIPGEYFVGAATILGVGAPKHPSWLAAATQVVHDGVVRNLIWHLTPLRVVRDVGSTGRNWHVGRYFLLKGL